MKISYELMNAWMGGMDAKRALILKNAAKLEAAANENGSAYAPVCKLLLEIITIMQFDTEKGKRTIENMASKGIITISKSGKGFKLCK